MLAHEHDQTTGITTAYTLSRTIYMLHMKGLEIGNVWMTCVQNLVLVSVKQERSNKSYYTTHDYLMCIASIHLLLDKATQLATATAALDLRARHRRASVGRLDGRYGGRISCRRYGAVLTRCEVL